MTILNEKQVFNLPIHDAHFYALSCIQSTNGRTSIIFNIRIIDESYDCGYAVPKVNGITQLVFKDCLWIREELYCDIRKNDSFDSLELLKSSTKLTEMKTRITKTAIYHYRLKLNSGSKFDIIAKNILITAQNEPEIAGICGRLK